TTPSTVPRVRTAAAAARQLFVKHAAELLGVDENQLQLRDGVFRADNGKEMTLAQLAADERLHARLSSTAPGQAVVLTPVEQWRILGTAVQKVAGRDAATGAALYPSDITRPGMLYGRVLRPPSYGATLESIDLQPAQKMEG